MNMLLMSIVIFLNGEIVYVVNDFDVLIIMVFDVFSGKFKVKKSFGKMDIIYFVFVKEGIVIIVSNNIFKLWNC